MKSMKGMGSGVYLQLQNEDGTTSGLVGVLDRLDDGLAVVKSKGRKPIPSSQPTSGTSVHGQGQRHE